MAVDRPLSLLLSTEFCPSCRWYLADWPSWSHFLGLSSSHPKCFPLYKIITHTNNWENYQSREDHSFCEQSLYSHQYSADRPWTKATVRISTSTASHYTPPLSWRNTGVGQSSSLTSGHIAPAQESLQPCWGNLPSSLTTLLIFSDLNRQLLRTSFSGYIILREKCQYWRKQVHLNVTLSYDSLVIPRVFSSRLSGLLNTKSMEFWHIPLP